MIGNVYWRTPKDMQYQGRRLLPLESILSFVKGVVFSRLHSCVSVTTELLLVSHVLGTTKEEQPHTHRKAKAANQNRVFCVRTF